MSRLLRGEILQNIFVVKIDACGWIMRYDLACDFSTLSDIVTGKCLSNNSLSSHNLSHKQLGIILKGERLIWVNILAPDCSTQYFSVKEGLNLAALGLVNLALGLGTSCCGHQTICFHTNTKVFQYSLRPLLNHSGQRQVTTSGR